MSELKAFSSERIYWAVEQVERVAGDIDRLHLDDNLFHLKSEVDKQIKELEENHKKEVEQLLMKISGLEKLVGTANKLIKQKSGLQRNAEQPVRRRPSAPQGGYIGKPK